MNNSMEKVYESMIAGAVDDKELENGPEYINLDDRKTDIWNKIKAMLPEDGQSLLDELDSVEGSLKCLVAMKCYEKGLHDSVSMLKLLQAL